MNPVIILLGGTFIPQPLAWRLYGRLASGYGVRFVHALPGKGLYDLDRSQVILERNVRACVPADSIPVELWGHSQGGIHAAMIAATWTNVQRIVTWGCPHHGTLSAWPFASGTAARLMPAMRDLRPGSSFIRRYEQETLPVIAPRLVSVYGRYDPVVQPYRSAHVPGAQNHLVASANHFGVLTRVQDLLSGKPSSQAA